MRLFNAIKAEPDYWLVDQIKRAEASEEEYKQELEALLEEWKNGQSAYLSLLLDPVLENWLLIRGFRKVSVIVEYTRELDGPFQPEPGVTAEALADSSLTDTEFSVLYDRCRSGSANKNNLFTIDQVMESLERELGPAWRTHCFIFRKNGEPAAITIPHLEPGTEDEGRLFYFGVVPEKRGSGLGTALHRLSLDLLKPFGARIYVGSTDEGNEAMIRIFERNGCRLRDRKGIYRIER